MRKITINDFKQNCSVVYSSKDIYLSNDISWIYCSEQDYLLTDISIMVVCMCGKMKIKVDNTQHTLTRHHMLFLQPYQVVQISRLTDNFKSRCLVFLMSTIENSIYKRRKIWDNSTYLRLYPIIPLSKNNRLVFKYYYDIAINEIQSADSLYKQEIIGHLLQSLMYELLLLTDHFIAKQGKGTLLGRQTSDDEIFRRFMELLSLSQGQNRKVEQYAELLAVHPDHLTIAVKTVCGHTPIELITKNTIKIITQELQYTEKNISEICYGLNFTSLSSFGKYVKKHTGLSPRAYKEQFEKNSLRSNFSGK